LAGVSKLGPAAIASYWEHLLRLYRWRFLDGRLPATSPRPAPQQ
jgi:hypothetical protein